MSKVYPLGSANALRVFAFAEQTTGRQDGWVMVVMEDAGILNLVKDTKLSDDDAARAAMVQAHRTDTFYKILAGILVEEGKPWSIESAKANAEFFAGITDPDQKNMLMANFIGTVSSFFKLAGRHSTPSATSSTPAKPGKASPRKKGELLTEVLVGTGPTPRDGSLTAITTA